jgi:hypothetical protein
MLAAYKSPNGPAAYKEITAMLADLKDPYTRLLPPDEYRDFVISSNGEMQGVGMLIANEPVEGHLVRKRGDARGGRGSRGARALWFLLQDPAVTRPTLALAPSPPPHPHPTRTPPSLCSPPSRAPPPTAPASAPATS